MTPPFGNPGFLNADARFPISQKPGNQPSGGIREAG